MIPSHLRTAARERIPSRRDFLIMGASAIVMKAADVAFDKLVVDPAMDAAAAADPVPHMRMDLGMREFDRLASPEQKATLHALHAGSTVPDFAAERCTELAERDGDIWVDRQGGEVSRILWGRPVFGRMADRPDKTFGRWRAECIRAAARRTEPTFELVRAVVDGRAHRYTALVVPGRTIRIVTARDEATRQPVRGSTAPTIHQGSA